MQMDDSQYFYRTAIFSRKNGEVSLSDIDTPENLTTLEGWLGIVVSLADGQHSIKQLLAYLRQQYPIPPANLKETLDSVIERLQQGRIIQLSESPVELPYYLAHPIEELDLIKAKKLIVDDGYTCHE